jgi:hypothetical protein
LSCTLLIPPLIFLRKRLLIAVSLLPLSLLSGFLASSRINIIIFFCIFFCSVSQSRLFSLPILLFLGYFSFKSIHFLSCLLTESQGFC